MDDAIATYRAATEANDLDRIMSALRDLRWEERSATDRVARHPGVVLRALRNGASTRA